MASPRAYLAWLLWGCVAMAVGLRVLNLAADPAYPYWWGYITDEGRWTQQARQVVLFGELDLGSWLSRMHLALAPLFQLVTAASFKVLGVGFAPARGVSALSGVLLVVGTFVFMRRRISGVPLLVAVGVMAFHADLVFLSRVAIPEMPSLLFEFLAFATLVGGTVTLRRALVAGLLTGLALAMKATVAPVALAFAGVLVVAARGEDLRRRMILLGAFLSVLLGPTLMAGALGFAVVGAQGLLSLLRPLGAFLSVDSPYQAAMDLVGPTQGPGLHLLLLAAWVLAGRFVKAGRLPDTRATSVYVGSAIWASAWILLSALMSYFPGRYVLHAVVPLILNVAAGLSLLRELPPEAHAPDRAPGGGRPGLIASLWIALPVAVLVSPLVLEVGRAADLSLERLRDLMALTGSLVILAAVLVRITGSRHVPAVIWSAWPLAGAAIWLVAARWGLTPERFWPDAGTSVLGFWAAVTVAAGVVSAAVASAGWGRRAHAVAVSGYLAVLAAVWLATAARPVVSPTFTLRDVSHALPGMVGEADVVGTLNASTLFLENHLRWKESLDPEVIVAMFETPPELREGTFVETRRFELELGSILSARTVDRSVRIFVRAAP